MMSKEAKIGLLLGLVFIVAIAVILRGVHRDELAGSDESAIRVVVDNGANNRINMPDMAASQVTDSNAEMHENTVPGFLSNPESDRNEEMASISSNSPTEHRPNPYGQSSNVTTLPTSYSSFQASEEIETPGSDRSNELTTLPSNNSPEIIVTTIEPPTVIITNNDMPLSEPVIVANSNSPSSTTKVYVVQKGDDLSKIAKNVYGSVEGNRWVNIKKIYNANTGKLPTMNDIKVGQKLTIPTLENGTFAPGFTGSAIITTSGTGSSTPPAPSAKVYIVKKDDSYWKIAETQLGKGHRYKEIITLNKRRDNDVLKEGEKLKLPAK